MRDIDMHLVDFEGCQLGLCNDYGVPFPKRWRLATTCGRTARTFSKLRCNHFKEFKHAVLDLRGSAPKDLVFTQVVWLSFSSMRCTRTWWTTFAQPCQLLLMVNSMNIGSMNLQKYQYQNRPPFSLLAPFHALQKGPMEKRQRPSG